MGILLSIKFNIIFKYSQLIVADEKINVIEFFYLKCKFI
jgi:hypothetical protein